MHCIVVFFFPAVLPKWATFAINTDVLQYVNKKVNDKNRSVAAVGADSTEVYCLGSWRWPGESDGKNRSSGSVSRAIPEAEFTFSLFCCCFPISSKSKLNRKNNG